MKTKITAVTGLFILSMMTLNAQISEENGWKKVSAKELDENVVKLIADDWMLISSGNKEKMNMMTASWGGFGNLWNKPVTFIFVRPQRYTFQFLEKNDTYTLTFFSEEYREALNICGTVSGRDVNKIEKSGLTPVYTESGTPAFAEAKIIVECKKLYADTIKEDAFTDKTISTKTYKEKDFHKMYIGEILNIWIKE